jgi:hypothetical protein
MEKILNSAWLAKSSTNFSKYSAKKWNRVQKKKYSANFIDYLGFLTAKDSQ